MVPPPDMRLMIVNLSRLQAGLIEERLENKIMHNQNPKIPFQPA